MGQRTQLSTETDSPYHCEGVVVTCARCGRPLTECGEDCETVIETRGYRVPTARDLAAVR